MSAIAVKFKQKILIGFLLSYIIILLLPLIIGSIVYKETLRIVEEDARQTNLSLLEQSKDVLDKNLADVNALVIQLAMNSQVNELVNLNRELKNTDTYKVMSVSKDLKPYLVANSFIKTFYIYIKRPNIILSPNAAYLKPDFFYGKSFKYIEEEIFANHEKLLEKRFDKSCFPAMPIIIEGKQHSVVTYVQSIPFTDYGDIKGAITVLIDESQFNKLLMRLYIGDSGWAYIMDKDGRVITSVSNKANGIEYVKDIFLQDRGYLDCEISGEKMTVSYTTSSSTGWKYVAVVPTNVVMAKAKYIKGVTLGITVAILFLGLMAACFLAYRKSKPIKEIITVIKDNIGEDTYSHMNEYDFVRGHISKLVDSNKSLKDTIQQQLPMLKSAFMDRLLKGEFSSSEEVQAFLGHTQIIIKGEIFIVMVLHIGEYGNFLTKDILEEISIKRIVIRNYLEKAVGNIGQLQNIDEDKLALLLGFASSDKQSFKKYVGDFVEEIYSELHNQYHIDVFFTIGGIYDNLIDVYRSFNDARYVQTHRQMDCNEKAVWYEDLPKDNEAYYYPIDTELRIINKVKAGCEDEVKKSFDVIYEENFIKRKLSYAMRQQLLTEIRGTVIKLFETIKTCDSDLIKGIELKIEKLDFSKDIYYAYNYLKESCLNICKVVNERKKSFNYQLAGKIMDYINASYMNQDICLISVAEKFKLSETYLSHFFKEQTGENFFHYIEKLRQQEAQKLLSQTSLSIDKIAECVGYSSSDTFRKAFNRFSGMNPVSYRSLMKDRAILS